MAEHKALSHTDLARRGLMFILSSPSGAGKTTISRKLLETDEAIKLSVSVTTRPMRPGEKDGVHYYFADDAEFDRMVEEDDFYEWAHVFGHRYGTPKGRIRDALKHGQDFLFDIDWQGTQQLYQKDQQDTVSVFILPPSIAELRRRLEGRAQDSAEVIDARMERARAEISHWAEYDYVVINDDLDECYAKVREILHAERMKRTRQTGLIPFVRELMG
ncbi:guanylate kinase [Alteriqipengyuania flavescens]|uniref:guanylate kinase n=1 Tax=Alteriqipengyuania flavescens TaxID=3053610 RepID=UPI0025B45A8B|nr:guanylate kinase [Alteriqipengyuania flavescens]WJY17741.1 guanylate kinase [Alteriqipengyuania flavescens]WJY23684.1 guanylate kinase [Alteriqipengyuania flavescens]